ncbi:endonuclease/exonuclease/phosphatase family protein [Bacteriovorax sp. BSW11_IV]|uniref:endonuclease/exonuclease/phosphatase family protein n=1 Tax=Bacteriovorax sp. BSW11_IV TaxID=1353529 RepID=UPI00038A4BB2|nr:endonuclease/exonuclease/phosphatase family protein [Bacteriovorax sp. BSW11_IV]EQC49872.1 endonuclease/exonuclease/phosphatase family protein [Bacteriovorax sp. BSW11_IV]
MKLVAILACILSFNASAKTLEFMSYNVENLFDANHDEGKLDWAYLPKSFKDKKKECKKVESRKRREECLDTDWTSDKVKLKVNQIADVVLKDRGNPPEFMALVEVENEAVVKQVADVLRYKGVAVTNSPDNRGVDVALLYNEDKGIKFVKKSEIVLNSDDFKSWPTRNILEVEFLVDKKYPLTVFVNHWPSLGNPNIKRVKAAEFLRKRIQELQKANKDHYVIAVGDFNTIDSNHPHPFKDVLLKDGIMYDLHEEYKEDKKISWDVKNSQPPGSYFFAPEMTWNVLDRIFLSPNLKDKKGLSVANDSYTIYAPNFITTSYEYKSRGKYLNGSKVVGVPKRYDHNASTTGEAGYSDHFPIIFKIKY